MSETPSKHNPGGKIRRPLPPHVRSEATFSPCERYRYSLLREWNAALPSVLFVMMNPSEADLNFNDPTVARCMSYAERWGYGRLYVGNVFAYRATDSATLFGVSDPVGPENLAAILDMAARSDRTVIAHGNLAGKLQRHATAVYEALDSAGVVLHYLRLTMDGTPRHPLYLDGKLEPVAWKRS